MDAPEFDGLLRRNVLGRAPDEQLAAAVSHLVEAASGTLAGLVFFGSRRSQARTDAHSAYDVFVVTREDGAFYRALRARGLLKRSPALLTAVGRVLPPSQISLRLPCGAQQSLHVKGSVLSLPALQRETSTRRRDHFCVARLFQPTSVLYAADDKLRDELVAHVAGAHRATLDWVRPSLPVAFDVAAYGRLLLEVSLQAEIRPESRDRAGLLWEAQRAYLDEVYGALLEEWARAGRLRRVSGDLFALAAPVHEAERRRVARYFRRSLVRATARWAKHVVTFDDWLDYIVHKVERHTGRALELTRRERRWPLIFLWPRVVGHLRGRGQSGE